MRIGGLENFCGAIGYQQNQGKHYKNQANRPREGGGEDFPPVLAVEFGACRHFGLVLGFDSLLLVPPGAAAVEVVSDVGGADDSHRRSIAQIF